MFLSSKGSIQKQVTGGDKLEIDLDIMMVGKTCKKCWDEGHRYPFYRYKAKPRACVRCRIRDNAAFYARKKGSGAESAIS